MTKTISRKTAVESPEFQKFFNGMGLRIAGAIESVVHRLLVRQLLITGDYTQEPDQPHLGRITSKPICKT